MGRELPRRFVHASGSIVPLAYIVDLATWGQLQLLFAVGIVVALSIEALRLLANVDIPYIDRLIRSYEEKYLAGYALYVIAGGSVGLVFAPEFAIPAILMLTLGDPIAGVLSSGELRRVKRPHVLAIMFTVCLIFALWSLDPLPAIAAAAVATVADGVKPVIKGYVIDDNLTIPVGAATTGYLVTEYAPSVM